MSFTSHRKGVANERSDKQIGRLCFRTNHDVHNYQSDGKERVMNSWCESCARKGCCYVMEIRPKCYVPTTNTASGTPETYLAKSLRYSRDNHEVADTPQTECDTCRHYKPACELFSEVCKYEPTTQTETENSNLTFETPQTESTGSPTGDYRDGVGAWQTEKIPAGCSKNWSAVCTSCERYFSCDYLSGRQTDCGWGKPTTVSHSKDKED